LLPPVRRLAKLPSPPDDFLSSVLSSFLSLPEPLLDVELLRLNGDDDDPLDELGELLPGKRLLDEPLVVLLVLLVRLNGVRELPLLDEPLLSLLRLNGELGLLPVDELLPVLLDDPDPDDEDDPPKELPPERKPGAGEDGLSSPALFRRSRRSSRLPEEYVLPERDDEPPNVLPPLLLNGDEPPSEGLLPGRNELVPLLGELPPLNGRILLPTVEDPNVDSSSSSSSSSRSMASSSYS
jgi:hypothetical protein